MKVAMLLLASGRGERLGAAVPKAFVEVGGVPLVLRSLRRLAAITDAREIVLAVNPDDRATHVAPIEDALRTAGLDAIVDGGATRQESMARAFAASGDSEVVLVHDAARPFFPIEATRRAIERAVEVGGALLAIPVADTLKRVAGATVDGTVDRAQLWAAQTPQVVRRSALRIALDRAARDGFEATDDVSLLEHAGIPVEVVEGSSRNLKVTTSADLALAEHFAREEDGESMNDLPRVGIGIDLHRLEPGRRCRIGGVDIDSEVGPVGHSDGDVVLHAVCDAVLGAAGLDDLGTLFSDRDPTNAARDSAEFCDHVMGLLRRANLRAASLDVVIETERPKIAPHRAAMRARVAELFDLPAERVNVRGKTGEGLDSIGEGRAIRATAVALLVTDAD